MTPEISTAYIFPLVNPSLLPMAISLAIPTVSDDSRLAAYVALPLAYR